MAKMQSTTSEAQEETRSERLSIAITPSEKRAIKAVAAIRGMEESVLVRSMPVPEIVAEFDRIQRAAESEVA